MSSERIEQLQNEAKRALGIDFLRAVVENDELSVLVPRMHIRDVLQKLRDDPAIAMNQLMDICGADYPERPERFEVIYNLLSLKYNWRIRVKVETDETSSVPSVTSVYNAAGWFERECWDLYGVAFSGNPDLGRILPDYGFEGGPLRKEFPVAGVGEGPYEDRKK